jgi:predicted transposase YbfD/YdcC
VSGPGTYPWQRQRDSCHQGAARHAGTHGLYRAIGCQTEIAQKILDRGGDYLLAVKNNQATLANALREFFADGETACFGALPVDRYQTVEKDHGRIKTRQALWVTDLSWLNRKFRQHWPKLAGVGMIKRRRELNGTASMERACYIGSQGITIAESFAKAVRSHWDIENSRHWVLDVTFREDDYRVRKDHAPHNFAALRKFALALLRQDAQYPKRSLRSRRKTADRISHSISRFIARPHPKGVNAIALIHEHSTLRWLQRNGKMRF